MPKKVSLKLPPDFAKAMRTRPKTYAIFKTMPPSHQRRYVQHIMEARQEATKRRRMTQALDMILHWRA